MMLIVTDGLSPPIYFLCLLSYPDESFLPLWFFWNRVWTYSLSLLGKDSKGFLKVINGSRDILKLKRAHGEPGIFLGINKSFVLDLAGSGVTGESLLDLRLRLMQGWVELRSGVL